jgi:hypothetical protein
MKTIIVIAIARRTFFLLGALVLTVQGASGNTYNASMFVVFLGAVLTLVGSSVDIGEHSKVGAEE